ncbi:hypothetical protein H5410_004349 [Solanum commersonii]|uniref:Uncharacterized protein n=1 Tax=Solanum commersonii TaxID=4109 RepID=A0A9J6B7F6_SOLCO|nr:hypothetical protein H5410_004349 [Solanum commersonii]
MLSKEMLNHITQNITLILTNDDNDKAWWMDNNTGSFNRVIERRISTDENLVSMRIHNASRCWYKYRRVATAISNNRMVNRCSIKLQIIFKAMPSIMMWE